MSNKMTDKELLVEAKYIIDSLMDRNKILSAKVETMELMGRIFHTLPADSIKMGIHDPSWNIQVRANEIQMEKSAEKVNAENIARDQAMAPETTYEESHIDGINIHKQQVALEENIRDSANLAAKSHQVFAKKSASKK